MTFEEPTSPPLERANPRSEQAHNVDDSAGDPVCWLDKVCPTCGRLTGDDEPSCPRCGDAMPR
jgi:hypothetical protein